MQFNYSVTTREAEKRLLPLCADQGVAVLVNRAFEDGNLFSQVRDKPLPPWAAEFGAQSWAQIFLKFVLAHPAVTCVIPATGKVRNLLDNLGAGIGPLPDAKQRAQIIQRAGIEAPAARAIERMTVTPLSAHCRARAVIHARPGRVADDVHAAGPRGGSAGRRILDHHAVAGSRRQARGRE